MGNKTPSKTTQTNEPWKEAKPYYAGLYDQAMTAFNNTNRTPYEGERYAGPNQTQQDALGMFKSMAGTAGTGGQELRQLGLDTVNGKYMNASTNPYLTNAMDTAAGQVQQRLQRDVLPALQDQSIMQGAYGGSGYGVAQGLATSDFTQQALDKTSQLSYDNYQQERQRQLQAGTLFDQANQLLQLPALLMDQAGTQEQAWAQAALDAQYQAYQDSLSAPWRGLGEFAQILNGGGFNTVTGTQPGASRAGSALQGAAGGAAAFNSLFPSSGGNGTNETGTAIAAALSGLLSGWG